MSSSLGVRNFIRGSLGFGLLLIAGLPGCSQRPSPSAQEREANPPAQTSHDEWKNADLTPLFSHIWRITQTAEQPPKGSILIFLPNGTLLQTSCVETYRIATWTVNKNAPGELHVVEDREPAYNAIISELSDTTLRLEQRLMRSKEARHLTLTAAEGEFVCPDLPK